MARAIPSRMERSQFILKLSQALADYFNEQLRQLPTMSWFHSRSIELGQPIAGRSGYYLQLSQIQTKARPHDGDYELEERQIDGQMVSVRLRNPWEYCLTYQFYGPHLGSVKGMQLAGDIQSLLFDEPYLHEHFLTAHNISYLAPVYLQPQSLEAATGGAEQQQETGVVASIAASFRFATGKAVAAEALVRSRNLAVGGHQRSL